MHHCNMNIRAAMLHIDCSGDIAGVLSQLTGLKRLRCSHNCLTSDAVPWSELCSLSQLTRLSLDNNCLTTLDPALFKVPCF